MSASVRAVEVYQFCSYKCQMPPSAANTENRMEPSLFVLENSNNYLRTSECNSLTNVTCSKCNNQLLGLAAFTPKIREHPHWKSLFILVAIWLVCYQLDICTHILEGGGGGWGIPFISPHGETWVPWAPLNNVWFSRSRVLNRVDNFTLQHCEQEDNHLSGQDTHLVRKKMRLVIHFWAVLYSESQTWRWDCYFYVVIWATQSHLNHHLLN